MKRNKKLNDRPWKMNFRSVPEAILAKINNLSGDDFVVSCVKKVRAAEIEAGRYSHLELLMKDGVPDFPTEQVPRAGSGRFSSINVHGKEVILKDKPMVSKMFSVEAPNWGDSYNGTHTIDFARDVYQREWFPPKELTLQMEILGEELKGEKTYVIRFGINEVLNKKSLRFRKSPQLANDLFFCLNLLQENAGAASIYLSNATRDDYLKTIFVTWEILPPGEREETIAKILSGYKSPTAEIRKKVAARYEFVSGGEKLDQEARRERRTLAE